MCVASVPRVPWTRSTTKQNNSNYILGPSTFSGIRPGRGWLLIGCPLSLSTSDWLFPQPARATNLGIPTQKRASDYCCGLAVELLKTSSQNKDENFPPREEGVGESGEDAELLV